MLPSVDTVDRGGDVSVEFAADDLVASLSQAGRSTAFGLDPARRRTARTRHIQPRGGQPHAQSLHR